jgi:hypothetical protein
MKALTFLESLASRLFSFGIKNSASPYMGFVLEKKKFDMQWLSTLDTGLN